MLKKTTRGMTAGMTRRGVGFAVAGGGAGYDTDAQAYITAVEAADGESLETGVKDAINAFVVGCKSDGIWTAIKASCILAGARTLSGALVPLKGTAPTNNNFVSGDYDRKLGLLGNGSTKSLDTNRVHNADPQDDHHLSGYHSTTGATEILLGIASASSSGNSVLATSVTRSQSSTTDTGFSAAAGFTGLSRQDPASYERRNDGVTTTVSRVSQAPQSGNLVLYRSGTVGYSSLRIAFYSIGESIDLALLDTRVTTLITDIGTALA